MIFTARAHHKLPNSPCRIAFSIRILRSEPFIVVVVSPDHYVRIRIVQRLPKRLHFQIIPVRAARAEQRLMPVRQRTSHRMRRQIILQPFHLRRTTAWNS